MVRITVFVIFILIIGFFIFYAIDNPGFVQDIFDNRPQDGSQTAEAAEAEEDPQEFIISGSQEEPLPAEPSLWQRITAFFREKFNPPVEEADYKPGLTLDIYFARTGQDKMLASEQRSVIAGNPGNALKGVMEELLRGPLQDYHYPVIPAGTRLLGSRVSDGVAEINLSAEFLDNALDNRILDEYIIYSIVNTVTGIPEIKGVIFFIEGNRITTYGNIDLSIPLIRNQDILETSE